MRLLWFATLAFGLANAIADIDKDGFSQDGRTTYCQAATTEPKPLEFYDLKPSSADKCSVRLEIKSVILPRDVSSNATLVDIAWSVSVAPGNSTAMLFPNVINATTKRPNDITNTLVRACRVGSNCATDKDVVIPIVVSSVNASEAFDAQGKRKLENYRFAFRSAGEYVLLAAITLPSDKGFIDFVVLQQLKITAKATTRVGASDAKNSTVGVVVGDGFNENLMTGSIQKEATPKPTKDASSQDKAVDVQQGSSLSSKTNVTNIAVLACVAATGIVVALVYFVGVNKTKKQQKDELPAHHYRDASDDEERRSDSLAEPTWHTKEPSIQLLQSHEQSVHQLAPSSFLIHPPGQWPGQTNGQSISDSISSGEDVILESNRSYATSFGSLHDSRVDIPSMPVVVKPAAAFYDSIVNLHDSHVNMPPVPRTLETAEQSYDNSVGSLLDSRVDLPVDTSVTSYVSSTDSGEYALDAEGLITSMETINPTSRREHLSFVAGPETESDRGLSSSVWVYSERDSELYGDKAGNFIDTSNIH